MQTTDLTEVIALAEKLSPAEKLQLIEHIARELQHKPQAVPRLSWKEACGLGKDIWEGVDIDHYIDTLRDEWDR